MSENAAERPRILVVENDGSECSKYRRAGDDRFEFTFLRTDIEIRDVADRDDLDRFQAIIMSSLPGSRICATAFSLSDRILTKWNGIFIGVHTNTHWREYMAQRAGERQVVETAQEAIDILVAALL